MAGYMIVIGAVILAMFAMAGIGGIALMQDGNNNILDNPVNGTLGNTSTSDGIKTTTTGISTLFAIIILVIVIFIVIAILLYAYSYT